MAISELGLAAMDTTTTLTRMAEAADLFGRLHDHVKRANCLNIMAILAVENRTRLDDAAVWLAEAERLALVSGNDHERLHAQVFRACLDQNRGNHATTETRFGGLLAEFRRIGDHRCVARCLFGLGRAAALGDDHERARPRFAEGLELAVGVGDLRAMLTGLCLLAGSDHATGHFRRAATLLGAAERHDRRARAATVGNAPSRGSPSRLIIRRGGRGRVVCPRASPGRGRSGWCGLPRSGRRATAEARA